MSQKSDIVIARLKATGLFDLEAGIGYCGSEEDYVDILEQSPFTFESSLNNLSKFFDIGLDASDEANLTEYRVVAHSIKSTARLLGFDSLFEIGKTSEFAVREMDVEKAVKNHPVLVEKTLEAIKLISGLFEGIYDGNTGSMDPDELKEVLQSIAEAAEDFDIDMMDEGVKKLKIDDLPECIMSLRKNLISAVANIDVDEVIAIVATMMEGLG